MPNSQCPNPDSLAAFAAAQLNDQTTAEVRLHVSTCKDCHNYLEKLNATLPAEPTELGSLLHALQAIPLGEQPIEDAGPPEIPGYQIIRRIGRGGMGDVYLALQKSPSRQVAIKLTRKDVQFSAKGSERFDSEIEAAGRLDHPGIVPVLESGTVNGQRYFSMPYVEGENLGRHLANSYIAPQQASLLVATIAEAVHYANSRGVIHRDLKPSNIMIDRSGNPRIADFGIAKNVDATVDLTATSEHMGTAGYMSPEQASGNAKDCSPQTDVYGLGAILYRILTGVPPFQGSTIYDTIRQTIDDDPIPVGQRNSNVSIDLQTVCTKCLQKNPAHRYQTALELAEDLRRYRDGKPVLARPVSGIERVWRWALRNKLTSSLASLIALVTVVSCVVLFLSNRKLQDANRRLENAQQQIFDSAGYILTDLIADPRSLNRGITREKQQAAVFVNSILDAVDELELDPENAHRLRTRGVARFRLGLLTAELSSLPMAISIEEEARSELTRLATMSDCERDDRLELAYLLRSLGFHYLKNGQVELAESTHSEGVEILEALQVADDLEVRLELAVSKQYQAEVGLANNDWETLKQRCDAAEQILSSLLEHDLPDDIKGRTMFFRGMNLYNWGIGISRTEPKKGSDGKFEQALTVYQKLNEEFPGNDRFLSRLAAAEFNAGSELIVADAKQAFKLTAQGDERLRGVIARQPMVVEYREIHADALPNLLTLRAVVDSSINAVPYCEEIRDAQWTHYRLTQDTQSESPEAKIDTTFQQVAMNLVALGNMQQDQSTVVQIGENALRVLKMITVRSEIHQAIEVEARVMLARNYSDLRDFPKTEQHWKAITEVTGTTGRLSIMKAISETNHLGGTYCNWANALRSDGKLAEATEKYRLAVELLKSENATRGNDDTDETLEAERRKFLRNTYWGLAKNCDLQKEFAEAAKFWSLASEQQSGAAALYSKIWQARSLNLGENFEAGMDLLKSLGDPSEMPINFCYDYAAAAALAYPNVDEAKDIAINILSNIAAKGFFASKQDEGFEGPNERMEFESLRKLSEFQQWLETTSPPSE